MKGENKTIIAYKGFDKNLCCRGFQYEVGKEYELPKGEEVSVCLNGFHACESPLEVLEYYFLDDNANLPRFCVVEQSGEFSKEGNSTKVASSKINIKKEITFADLIKLGIEWLKEKTSDAMIGSTGDFANIVSSDLCAKIASSDYNVKIGSSGYNARIASSGDSAKIGSTGDFASIGSSGEFANIASSGDNAQIGSSGGRAQIASSGYDAQIASSGYNVKIGSLGEDVKIGSTGDYAKIGSSGGHAQIASSSNYVQIGSLGDYAKIASSGDSAQIGSLGDYAKIDSTGEDSVIMCAGRNSRAKAKKGSWITLAEWYKDDSCGEMKPKCVKTEYVDGERIKADTWYKLVDGEFVETDE